MELNREHFRAMVFYDFKSCLSHRQCHDRLTFAFGDSAPAFPSVTNWFRELSRGTESIEDEARPGRPSTATTGEIAERVRSLVVEDRRITYEAIQTTLGISSWTVKKILHEDIGFHKLSSRWIPNRRPKNC